MKERTMNEDLLVTFPELKNQFSEFVSWQDGMDTGAFLTYEDILLPHLIDAVENDNEDVLNRSSKFIEEHLTNRDDYSANVIYVGILEGLKAHCDASKVKSFLLDNARREFEDDVLKSNL